MIANKNVLSPYVAISEMKVSNLLTVFRKLNLKNKKRSKNRFKIIAFIATGFCCLISTYCTSSTVSNSSFLSNIEENHYDLVVVGATPGGISCAVRAAREGLQVLLVERTQHIGGFISSGGGGWEAPYDGYRSPLYSEVKSTITNYYKEKYGDNSSQYLASIPTPTGNRHIDRAKVEPKVAEMLFNQMVESEKKLTLLKGYFPIEVNRRGETIISVKFKEYKGTQTIVVAGNIFSDCTYEGDLAALSGIRYRVGRESRAEYNEPHAGVIYTKKCVEKGSSQRFSTDAVEGRLKIRTFPGSMCKEEILPESTGKSDSAVMAYNYRLILTSDPENQNRIEKPEGYDPSQFTGFNGGGRVPNIPNRKIGYNSGRIVGLQIHYPESNWKVRDSISQIYLNYILQELYYLQNDAPIEIQQKWRKFGLAKDEFPDNGNVPYEIYVREARRIVGKYVFTEHDNIPQNIERTKINRDAIAITDWPVDHVACINRSVKGGNLDGIMFLAESSKPAQIPYRCMLPQGVDNLLVPVCMSTSHVGWGSVRLEPVWMQIGEAAGFAAALSVKSNIAPAGLGPDILLHTLVKNKFEVALFSDIDVSKNNTWNAAIQYFGTKGFFRGYYARPKDNLTSEVAELWIKLFDKLVKKESYDETAEAEKLPKEGKDTSINSLSMAEFVSLLQDRTNLKEPIINSAVKNLGDLSLSDTNVSRANACLLMYNLLENSKQFELRVEND